MFPTASFGESVSPDNFGTRLIPDKLVENTDATLQVYTMRNGDIFPKQIQDLTVTSSDSSIIEIVGMDENENSFIRNVKVKAVDSGTATISMAADGFLPYDLSVTVHGNKNKQSQLLIKTVPDTFTDGGADTGFVSVELADEDGYPVRATKDISVKLNTSTDGVVLKNTELDIKIGEYFTLGEFELTQPRTTTIYASALDMETVGSTITVDKNNDPLKVRLYVYPDKISVTDLSSSYAYAIVQLQDSEGNPVIAKEPISVSLKISEQNQAAANTSGEFTRISQDEPLSIQEGSYWAYTKLVARSGIEGTYDVSISAKNYQISNSEPVTLDVVKLELMDDKFAKIDLLPILATGNEELIGVIRLEDENPLAPNPVAATKDLQIRVDSSDLNALSIKNVKIGKGTSSALLFGDVGHVVPDELTLNVISEKDQTLDVVLHGYAKKSFALVAEPAISKVLAGSHFPLAVYMSQGNGGASYFTIDSQLSVSPNELVQIKSGNVYAGKPAVLLDAEATKKGTATLTFEVGDFKTSTTIDNLSTKPTSLHLGYPEPVLINPSNVFSIEILNEYGVPLFADEDKEIRIVSSDKSIIEIPETVTIKQGNYYTLFEVVPKETGKTTITVLSNETPTSKFDIIVESFMPEIMSSYPEDVSANSDFDASITAKYLDSPLEGLNVKWKVQGAAIKGMDEITDSNGQARISLKATSPNLVILEPTVSGSWFAAKKADITVSVNQDAQFQEKKMPLIDIYGFDGMIILVPCMIVATGFLIKRKGMLTPKS